MKIKEYILFAGNNYYPFGGVDDLKATAETVKELKQLFNDKCEEWSRDAGVTFDAWGQIVRHKDMKPILNATKRSEDDNLEWTNPND